MESRIRRDDDGDKDLVIRKLVKFRKPGTRLAADDNVEADIRQDGALIVNKDEVWLPDLGDPAHPQHHFTKGGRRVKVQSSE